MGWGKSCRVLLEPCKYESATASCLCGPSTKPVSSSYLKLQHCPNSRFLLPQQLPCTASPAGRQHSRQAVIVTATSGHSCLTHFAVSNEIDYVAAAHGSLHHRLQDERPVRTTWSKGSCAMSQTSVTTTHHHRNTSYPASYATHTSVTHAASAVAP